MRGALALLLAAALAWPTATGTPALPTVAPLAPLALLVRLA